MTYIIRWWKSPFASVTIEMSGNNAQGYAWFAALERGWKPRKWYEIWRWFDCEYYTNKSGDGIQPSPDQDLLRKDGNYDRK